MLDVLFPSRRTNYADRGWPALFGSWGRRTKAGVRVTEDSSLTLAAWWCGCRILTEAVASLPLIVYQRDGDDRKPASDLPLFDLLWRSPNPDMPSGPFREGRVLHQINYGNGFAEIEWDSYNPTQRTRPLALWPIHAGRVRPVDPRRQAVAYADGFRYCVRNNDNTETLLKADEMLHLPGIFPEDGIWGKSAVQYHRESIGFGQGVEQYGSTFFGTGGQPRAVVEGLGMRDPEARALFRKEWKELHGDPNSGEIGIVPDGAKFTLLTMMNNQNAQFLETRQMNKRQIASILRVPLYMMEESESAPGGVVEQKSLEFVVYSLMPWLRKWEEAVNHKLLLGSQRQNYFAEFLLAALLRGDFKSRMASYVEALNNGIMSVNEVRRLENLPGIGPAGDVIWRPAISRTIEQAIAGPPVPAQSNGPTIPQDKSADEFTREMVAKAEEAARKAAGLSHARPLLALPAARRNTVETPVSAVRGVLADAGARALTKLAKALSRDVAKVTDFAAWLDRFLADHGPALSDALEPAAAVLGRADVSGASLWAMLATAASQDIGAAFETLTREKLTAKLAGWPREAADRMAASVLEQQEVK